MGLLVNPLNIFLTLALALALALLATLRVECHAPDGSQSQGQRQRFLFNYHLRVITQVKVAAGNDPVTHVKLRATVLVGLNHMLSGV
jgi:hypothetical protein